MSEAKLTRSSLVVASSSTAWNPVSSELLEVIDEKTSIESLEVDEFAEFSEKKFSQDILAKNRIIDCKYQYDNIGSFIFKLQCQQPEYYLTRAEEQILVAKLPQIIEKSGCKSLIDLGAGSGEKVIRALSSNLWSTIVSDLEYIPIDLNQRILRDCISTFRTAGLKNPLRAIAGCYPDILKATAKHIGPKLFASFGSSIGNQEPPETKKFLKSVHDAASENDKLLLGVDITVDTQRILGAYRDQNNVNRIHNLNVLNHVNRRHNANFNVDDFDAVSEFNYQKRRIETFVFPRCNQHITCFDGSLQFSLEAGEKIRTEISQKFAEDELITELSSYGFDFIKSWKDVNSHFLLALFGLRGGKCRTP